MTQGSEPPQFLEVEVTTIDVVTDIAIRTIYVFADHTRFNDSPYNYTIISKNVAVTQKSCGAK